MNENYEIDHLIKCLRRKFGDNEIKDNTEEIDIVERHEFNKAETIQAFRKLLKNPDFPIWYVKDIYQGVFKDKDNMSTEALAKKYGSTETRIKAIIKSELWNG